MNKGIRNKLTNSNPRISGNHLSLNIYVFSACILHDEINQTFKTYSISISSMLLELLRTIVRAIILSHDYFFTTQFWKIFKVPIKKQSSQISDTPNPMIFMAEIIFT
ncbi:hypothetical protein SAMN04487825_1372 [Prevotella sp. kh1p2]|nr:hypothetical protein SAMN04487825_1372 [Prevotella sp. kh1p2]SNU12442.1 hypothetical protein SAMN06298210_1262 [Prevotellaceae bacterium KH2P17]